MSIVTKKGDAGTTGLASGESVPKNDVRIEACGTLDELVSFLGLARTVDIDATIAKHLRTLQCHMFLLGTEFSGGKKFAEPVDCCASGERKYSPEGIKETHLKEVEDLIEQYEDHSNKVQGFVVPGDSMPEALIDCARVICRRLERRMVDLKSAGYLQNGIALKYVNRVADLLYILARHV